VVDPHADRPVARQLADHYRDLIRGGRLQHGWPLPAERRIGQEHGVGVDTVRAALTILRGEGLVETRARYGSYVRRPERRQVRVPRGSRVEVVMPSPEQRREWDVPEGVAVVLLTHPSGEVEPMPADEVTLTFS